MEQSLFDVVLDNIPDGIYVLDDKGNYIYANSVYIQLVNMSKSDLMGYNVHDFLHTKQIDFCISDIVYKEKRRIVMFQDLFDRQNLQRKIHRQLVISSPIFDETGKVCNIIAVVRPVPTMNDYYHQATLPKLSPHKLKESEKEDDVIAESPAMIRLLKTAKNVASVDSAVLITGESGTGKEVVAQYIHKTGNRSKKAVVVINCASLPASLLEAELFGYDKGAFTGASATGKAGLFEEADGSTLFLDEVNSLPLDLQGKLLRAIETKTIQRIGSTKSRSVDFRLIAATNEDLGALVADKRFRIDLFYRLNVIPLNIPPLRERPEDILPLALHFLKYYCRKYDRNKLFSDNTLQLIQQFGWPGNVRELKNFVERSVVMSMGDYIEIQNIEGMATNTYNDKHSESGLPASLESYSYAKLLEDGITLDAFIVRCELAYLKYALDTYKSSYLAAEALGTSQSSIMRRKKKYNI